MHIYENMTDEGLDLRLITVMAMNVKTTDTAIGHFGTGMKYALAVLTRYGCTVTIQTGDGKEYRVDSRVDTVRGKEFTMMYLVNTRDKKDAVIHLPFTTELGKSWDMWMAVREIESNMRDESGTYYTSDRYFEPTQGIVRFYIEGQPYDEAIREHRHTMFFDLIEGPVTKNKNPNVDYKMHRSAHLYFKGVRVYQHPEKKQYINTYNFTDAVELSEDRVIKDSYYPNERIARMFRQSADADATQMRKRILDTATAAEWDIDLAGYSCDNWDVNVIKQVDDHIRRGGHVDAKMNACIIQWRVKNVVHEQHSLHSDEEELLADAIQLLGAAGYEVTKYEIKVMRSLPENAIGLADCDNKVIFISAVNFENGLQQVMGTLLEEYIHIEYNFRDETRQMQDWLLRRAVVHMIRERKLEKQLRGRDDNKTEPESI